MVYSHATSAMNMACGGRRAVRSNRCLKPVTSKGCQPVAPRLSLTGTRPASRISIVSNAAPTSDLPTDTYDYIIVGGGLAGCLLANRLSADPSKRVLVLEAGETNTDPVVKIPIGLTRLFKHPTLDWNLRTTPQPSMGGRDSYIARGKLLGGSSSTNATLYHRGTAADYDAWGLEGWASKDVLPWFKCAEDNPAFGESTYHGTGGAMHVEKPIYQNKLFDTHFAASEEIGMQPNPDFNDWSHSQEGFGEFQVAITSRGRRADAYRQFLKPIISRGNLEVVVHAQTSKVITEERNGEKVAVGVEVQTIEPGALANPAGARATVTVKPGGEVILAAGAIHSPQILMLSGIGPSRHLAEHGVTCVSDLAGVGENLQDHPAVLSAFHTKESAGRLSITDHVYDDNANIKKSQLLNWFVRGKGPLTSTSCDRGAFVKTKEGASQPDLQLRYVAALALNPDGVGSFVDFGLRKAKGDLKRWPSGITFQVIACRPKSRGSVRLQSGSISTRPAIDLAYLTDAAGEDAATLRDGIRLSRKLAATSAWSELLEEEMHPGAGKETDADLDEYLQTTLHSANALVGTCAMGAKEKGGVVSPDDFSVHGVKCLRVVDASVMPVLPGGQTGAPTVMLAERAAAMMTQGKVTVESVQPELVAA